MKKADRYAKGGEPGRQGKKGRYHIARGIAMAAFGILLVASLVWQTGWGSFSAFGVSFVQSVCPLGVLETFVTGKNTMVHSVVLLMVALVLVIVFGKAFCGWLCPSKHIQRFFRGGHGPKKGETPSGACAESLPGEGRPEGEGASEACAGCSRSGEGSCSTHRLDKVGGVRDGMKIDGRHVVLGGTLLSAAVFGFPVFCLVCPVGLSVATIVGLWHLFQFNETSWGLLAFPAVLVLELVVFRKWCTKICPLSALLSLVSGLNHTFKPVVDEKKCLREAGIDCRTCVEVCPEEVDPHSRHIPECSKCGKCVDSCPAQAIAIKVLPGGRSVRD